MPTLYIRDVPEDVTAVLKERAAETGLSLSGYVTAELSRVAATPSNATLLARLRRRASTTAPGRVDIVEALHAERG